MQKEKQEKLLKALLIQNASTSWYQSQMRQVLAAIEEIENGIVVSEQDAERYYELQGKLFYLLGKGIWERKLQTQLRKEIKRG